ncbi:cytochrome P450 [Streptomyces hygroscopicus]|uniref:cytochrome P450 n=1 Tax=Streptomyces hygroscopicus TaxID=1912 RepID=UPI00099E276F|nr:cytochrome P450 [Streptomyces hygroscopicus]
MSDEFPANHAPRCPVSERGHERESPPRSAPRESPRRSAPVAPGRLPLLGHMWPLMRDPFTFFTSLRHRGDIVRIYMGRRPIHFLTTARLAHQILVENARSFDKGMVYDAVHPLSGNGLLASGRELHRRQRRIIQPLFHKDMIKVYAETMSGEAQSLADSWRPGQRVDLDQVMIELTLTTLVRSMFSGRLPRSVVRDILHSLPLFTRGMVARTVLPAWLCRVTGFDRRFLAAAGRLRSAVDAVVRSGQPDGVEGSDLLSFLRAARDPETGQTMSDELIRDELVSIMMAGTETTGATLAWTFHELTEHPAVEQRLRAELRDVLGGRPAGYDDLADLRYTRAVVNEVLRRYSLLMLFRRTTTPVVLGGVALPAGADVMFSQSDLHRDAGAFPEPDAFSPERWLVDRDSLPPREAFIPFGAGNRRCIGEGYAQAEAVIALATILTRWRLVPVPGHVRRVAAAMPRPRSLPMTVTPVADEGSVPHV